MLLDRDRNRWLVLTVVVSYLEPQFQLLNGAHVIPAHSTLWAFHGKGEHGYTVRCGEVWLRWYTFVLEEHGQRVFVITSDCPDIERVVSCMDTRSCVNKLRHSARRFDTGDSCTLLDA